MDITSDFKSYHEQVTKSLVDVVKTGGHIANADLSFHRSNIEVSVPLAQQTTRLLRLTDRLLQAACQDSSVKPPTLQSRDDVDDSWRKIVNVVDDLLEKTDVALDEFTGAIRRMSPAPQDDAQTPTRQAVGPRNSRSQARFPSAPLKPQAFFHRKVDNFSTHCFKPLLNEKPHAIRSLSDSIGEGPDQYGHPYADEISQYQYPPRVYEPSTPIPFPAPSETPVILVESEYAMHEMLNELKTAKEIAIDLEHNEYRSYYGIVSLMQISTRTKDWIVDTLLPWREKLQALNEVFADPSIVKVFHGSSMDMIWLQRDLGLYVVGLFDTYYACEALQFPGRGLKYLLQRFADFEAQKQYQMADWRLRPLPADLIEYARSDTHYLLHIYDCVKLMLIKASTPQTDLIDHVLQGSKKEALQTYTRFVYDRESGRGPSGWYNTFTDQANHFNTEQFAVFRALHEWRDTKAREEDEGLAYIFNSRVLWTLAEWMPTNRTKLHSSLRPVPPNVQNNDRDIFETIQTAKMEAVNEPLPYEFLRLNQEKYGIPHNRWRKFREEKTQSQHTGLAATLQQLNQNGDLSSADSPGVNSGPPTVARVQRSMLWGNLNNASPGISIEVQTALNALETVLPLPSLSATAFAETNGDHPPSTTEEPAISIPPPVRATPPDTSADDVFTLRQQSRKRKISDLENDDSPQAFHTPSTTLPEPAANGATSPTSPDTIEFHTPNTTTPEYEAKRLAKQQRKAEKRARKAAQEAEATAQAANSVPFDYAAAESMIDREPPNDRGWKGKNAKKKEKKDGKSGDGGKAAPMNPFARALDTGTGAKRNVRGKEGSGRSMTFQ